MANLTLSAKSSVDTTSAQFAVQLGGALCGEDIAAGQALELRSDGKLYKHVNKAFIGIAPRPAKAGQPLTAYATGTRFKATDGGLTPGNIYYLSDTAGLIADAATTKDTKGTFYAVSTQDLVVRRAGPID